MAAYNQADDIAELSRCVAQLFRLAMGGRPVRDLAGAAAAAGLSVDQARQFVRGELQLPPRQSVSFANAMLEQARVAQVGYMDQLRQGHAGGGAMSASYAGRVIEQVVLPRGRTEDRERVTGGPAEATVDDVAATVARLEADFAGWKFEVDGEPETKLVWLARNADHHVSGATSLELAAKPL